MRDLADGVVPPQPLKINDYAVNGQDTILTLPPQQDGDDSTYLTRIGEAVMEAQFDAETLCDATRDDEIIRRMKYLEADGVG